MLVQTGPFRSTANEKVKSKKEELTGATEAGDRKLMRLDINPDSSVGLPKVGRKKRPKIHEKAAEHHWREV